MTRPKCPRPTRQGETFLPLSRGLKKYQRVYTPTAISLWLWLLQEADWRPGRDFGALTATLRELKEGLALDRKTIQAALSELDRGYPFPQLSRNGSGTAPPFIKILSEHHGRGKSTIYRIRIRKAKLRLSDVLGDKIPQSGKKHPISQSLDEEILGGKIREIKDIVSETAEKLDMKKLTEIKPFSGGG